MFPHKGRIYFSAVWAPCGEVGESKQAGSFLQLRCFWENGEEEEDRQKL